MPPVVVGASRFASALETGEAKLWVLLIGVNNYQDPSLPSLQYAAVDCQGIAEALKVATDAFPHKEFSIHHDFSISLEDHLLSQLPILETVQASLQRLVTSAQGADTVLVYFSGHGVLEPDSGATILCLQDTDREQLLSTGLHLQSVLEMLGRCRAHKQLLWLDACHSGNISLGGNKGSQSERPIVNPTPQVLELLRHRAVNSRGFYALLSCDEGQQSWEFPDLGHGVFSYYLMRGLRGEAADHQGVIDADSLYQYIYRQTTQYIERINQQLRLVNQHKRSRGEKNLYPEYSPQTPKRIVAGVGEIILGIKPDQSSTYWQDRYALVVDAIGDHEITDPLTQVLQHEGKFQLDYLPTQDLSFTDVRERVQVFLQSIPTAADTGSRALQPIETRLLYLRGHTSNLDTEDAGFRGRGGVYFYRSWLRQELRRSANAQQMIMLDCPGATDLADWVEELKIATDRSQCIIACASLPDAPGLFAQVILEALISASAVSGLSVASLLARIQENLDSLGVDCQSWLSGTQGLMEILPATSAEEREPIIPSGEIPPVLTTPPDPLPIATPPISPQPTITVLSVKSESLDRIEGELGKILAALVGPIAPTLLAQVTQDLTPDRPQIILERILPLLPIALRDEFSGQVRRLFQGVETQDRAAQIPQSTLPPLGNQRTSPPTTSLPLAESGVTTLDRMTVESILRDLVGPIASTLLKQINEIAWASDKSLIEALSPYLTPHQCTEVATRLSSQAHLVHTRSSPVETEIVEPAHGRGIADLRSQAQPRSTTIDDRFVQRCEEELIQAIGPVAKIIVATTRIANPQVSTGDFVLLLARQIPQPEQAQAFSQRMTSG
jgi:uncharacterized caspase-like protein